MSFFAELLGPWSAFQVLMFAAILIELAAIASALHALRHVRSSQATVAWSVALVVMPWFALPLYWIFARNRFAGYREAIRDVAQSHHDALAVVRKELATESNIRSTGQATPLEQVADILDTPLCEGNEFELLIDGNAFADALIEAIRAADEYIYVAFYIIRDDSMGNRFADALIERASHGVTVRLLYDEVGCLKLSSQYLNRIRNGGVDVRPFNTRQGWVNRFQINFRNHRKLLVVDGTTAIVGGLNIGDEYLGTPKLAWRDTALLARGSIAKKVQAAFARDYYWAARTNLPEANWSRDVPTALATENHSAACITGPADLLPRATMMFVAAIASARHRVWISSPYLVPSDALVVALAMARARGVEVKLLIPSYADEWPVYLAGFHYETELAELDIGVYRYQDGFLHQKCVLIDDSMVLIGSTNLDNRSLHLNFELMLAVQDSNLVLAVTEMLEQDFARSTRHNGDENNRQPMLSRMGTAIARLFSPVL